MSKFIPYGTAYGEEESYYDIFEQAAPALSVLLQGEDPRQKSAALEVKISNLEGIRDQYPAGTVLYNLYNNQIKVNRAKLGALETEADEARFEVTAFQTGQVLTNALLVIGGVALIAWVRVLYLQGQALGSD